MSSALASGGYYGRCTWSALTETELARAGLSAAQVQAAAGGNFRFFSRYVNVMTYTDLWLRLSVCATGNAYPLVSTPWTWATAGAWIDEFGTLRLPPFKYSALSAVGAFDLVLSARKNTAGSYTLDLDYLLAAPDDGLRIYRPYPGYGLAYNSKLIDNSILGKFSSQTGAYEGSTHTAYGIPLKIYPSLKQRFMFMWEAATDGALIARTAQVQLWYRPRRRLV
jgi:hypothetical protein